MFKKILILSTFAVSTSAMAGGFTNNVQGLRGSRPTVEIYQALTYIISTDTPPPISKASSLNLLKNHTADALAEQCYYAGALQLRLNHVFVRYPSASQAAEPLRTQLQSLIESGQKSLTDVCAASDANKRIPTLQRVNNVENLITDIRNEAINLRIKLPIHR